MYLIAAYRIDGVHRYYRLKELEDEQQQDRETDEKEELLLNQENILADVMQLLLKKRNTGLSLQLALFLGWRDTVCNIYDAQIEKDRLENKPLNLKMYQEYAEYCFKNGRR
jgi:hypothetical protein